MWASAHFFWATSVFGAGFCDFSAHFAQKMWAFAHFYFKSGQPETVGAQGISGFLPTFPLFFSISMIKNLIFI